jgi:HAMP domain-containing protein
MAIGLVLLGAACVVVATTGLIGQKGKVHQVSTVFKDFRTERDAYEGWLTADDQMNMYAALEVLQDPSQRHLANVTWGQVVQGHAQALSSLQWLIDNAFSPAIRAKAQSTLADLNSYYTFTQRMHHAVLAGNPREAVRLVTVNNAPSSNKTQADFDAMGKTLSAQAAQINTQANSAASSSVQLVIIVAVIIVILAVLITWWLARSITRPLAEITAAAEKIAEGDLDVEVRAETDDEIGRLATAFGNSVDYLGEMAGAADRIADGDLAVTVAPAPPATCSATRSPACATSSPRRSRTSPVTPRASARRPPRWRSPASRQAWPSARSPTPSAPSLPVPRRRSARWSTRAG